MTLDDTRRAALEALLAEHDLSADTRLYREAMLDALIKTEEPGVMRLAANPAASESVLDVYGPGYLVQAPDVGPGLAFAESSRPNWQETVEMRALRARGDEPDKVEVEILLGDVLAQGGLIYPVKSVTVERAWYCTLPEGSITVRLAA